MSRKVGLLLVSFLFLFSLSQEYADAQRRSSSSKTNVRSSSSARTSSARRASSSTARSATGSSAVSNTSRARAGGTSIRARSALRTSSLGSSLTTTTSYTDNIPVCKKAYTHCMDLMTNYFISKQKFMQEDPGIAEMLETQNVFRCLYSDAPYGDDAAAKSFTSGLDRFSKKSSSVDMPQRDSSTLPKSAMLHKIYNYYCKNPPLGSSKDDIDRQNCVMDEDAEKNVRASGTSIAYLNAILEKNAAGTLKVQEINKDFLSMFGVDFANDIEESTIAFYLSVSPYNLYYDPNVYLAEANRVCFMAETMDSSNLKSDLLKEINRDRGLKSALKSTDRNALIDDMTDLKENNCFKNQTILTNYYLNGTWNLTLSNRSQCESLGGYWDDQVDGECKEVLTSYLAEDICFDKGGDWLGADENGNGGMCVRDNTEENVLSDFAWETPEKSCFLYESTLKSLRNRFRDRTGDILLALQGDVKSQMNALYKELLADASMTVDEKIEMINKDLSAVSVNFSASKVFVKSKYKGINCENQEECIASLESLRNKAIELNAEKEREQQQAAADKVKYENQTANYEEALKKYQVLSGVDATSFLSEVISNVETACSESCEYEDSSGKVAGLDLAVASAYIEKDGFKITLKEILSTDTVENKELLKSRLKTNLANTFTTTVISKAEEQCVEAGGSVDPGTGLCYATCNFYMQGAWEKSNSIVVSSSTSLGSKKCLKVDTFKDCVLRDNNDCGVICVGDECQTTYPHRGHSPGAMLMSKKDFRIGLYKSFLSDVSLKSSTFSANRSGRGSDTYGGAYKSFITIDDNISKFASKSLKKYVGGNVEAQVLEVLDGLKDPAAAIKEPKPDDFYDKKEGDGTGT